jgi:hypothetical protein
MTGLEQIVREALDRAVAREKAWMTERLANAIAVEIVQALHTTADQIDAARERDRTLRPAERE